MRVNTLSRSGFKVYDAPKFDTDLETSAAINYRIESTDKLNQFPILKQAPLFTSDGKRGVFIRGQNSKGIEIFDCVTDSLISEIPCTDAQSMELSPLGTYLTTWSRPSNPATSTSANTAADVGGNLKIWDTQTATVVISFSQKTAKKDTLQWTQDEELLFHSVSNELHIFDGKNLQKGIINKVFHKAYSLYKVSSLSSPCVYIALFNPEASGKPARISIYSYQKDSSNIIGSNSAEDGNNDGNSNTADDDKTNTENTASTSTTHHALVGELKGPINSRTMFSATDATCYWNSTGEALLIHTHADVDSSNSSYYGATGLFLLTTGAVANSIFSTTSESGNKGTSSSGETTVTTTNSTEGNKKATTGNTSKTTTTISSAAADKELVSMMVSQSKEGPVYDVKWAPDGQKFIVCAGNMPCHTTVFSLRGEPLFECGAAHRNTISFSPHGRFLCIAGFGNLAGEMDFYDTNKMKKLGSNSAHCTVAHSWSPDSRYFMTAILAPRMNVDNSYRIFKYNGLGPVVTHHQPENDPLYAANWFPMDSKLFPNRGSSPKRASVVSNGDDNSSSNANNTLTPNCTSGNNASKSSATAASKLAPYRPPGSTGALSDLLKRESSVTGKVGAVGSAGSTNTTAAGGKPGAYKAPPRRIPGMPPPGSNSSNNNSNSSYTGATSAGVNNQKKQKEKKEPTSAVSAATVMPPLPPATATTSSLPVPSSVAATVVEEEKSTAAKLKSLKKRLKQIQEIKEKHAKRQQQVQVPLNADQIQKLSSEDAIVKEIAELELSTGKS